MDHATVTQDDSPVVELRQYTMQPGRRDDFLRMFDDIFVDALEADGMRVLGEFRDLGRENYVVWMRGFASMEARQQSLTAFYSGPVWQQHRNAANGTIADSDDVLLLKPVTPRSGVPQLTERPGAGGGQRAATVVLATIYLLTSPVNAQFREFFDQQVTPAVERAGARPVARYETDSTPNNYPRLPVRAGENAYVWITTFPDAAALQAWRARREHARAWPRVQRTLQGYLAKPVQELVLEPTGRSKLRHVPGNGFTLGQHGARSDFDFLAGDWVVANRALRERGTGSEDWEEFSATAHSEPRLGGIANVDEMDFAAARAPGMTVRTFDAARQQWSIYWVSARDGVMTPPVIGGFEGGRGLFYGQDVAGGRPVQVRFTWTQDGADRARWEQAFSYDEASWETNWTMDFTRAMTRRASGAR